MGLGDEALAEKELKPGHKKQWLELTAGVTTPDLSHTLFFTGSLKQEHLTGYPDLDHMPSRECGMRLPDLRSTYSVGRSAGFYFFGFHLKIKGVWVSRRKKSEKQTQHSGRARIGN